MFPAVLRRSLALLRTRKTPELFALAFRLHESTASGTHISGGDEDEETFLVDHRSGGARVRRRVRRRAGTRDDSAVDGGSVDNRAVRNRAVRDGSGRDR